MTFKEAYFSNVVWQPDTILRIMINMDGVSIFEEANKAAVKYGHLHVSRPINFKIVPDFPLKIFSNFLVQNLALDG